MPNPNETPPLDESQPSIGPKRYLGLAIDIALFVLLFAWSDIVFLTAFDPTAGQTTVSSGWTTGGGFGLSPRGGDVIGVGLTGIVLAMQTPFLWRGRTLGLSLMGLELRRHTRPAPLVLSTLWTVATWALSAFAVVGMTHASAQVLSTGALTAGAVVSSLVVVAAVAHSIIGASTGRSGLEHLFGLRVQRQSDPIAALAKATDTAWAPRADFVVNESRPVDKDVALWRANMSVDPFGGIVGPDPSPMAQAYDEPEHLEYVDAASAMALAQTSAGALSDEELAQRIRRSIQESNTPDD